MKLSVGFPVDAEQILAFRLARSGLASRNEGSLAGTVACPASDFARDAALIALAARHEGLTREGYDVADEAARIAELRGAAEPALVVE